MIAASENAHRPSLVGYSGKTVLKSNAGNSFDKIVVVVPVSHGLSEFSIGDLSMMGLETCVLRNESSVHTLPGNGSDLASHRVGKASSHYHSPLTSMGTPFSMIKCSPI